VQVVMQNVTVIEETHNRAHRALVENYKQIRRLYYWPNLYTKLKEYIKIIKFAMRTNSTDTPLKFQLEKTQYRLMKEKIYTLIYTMRKA